MNGNDITVLDFIKGYVLCTGSYWYKGMKVIGWHTNNFCEWLLHVRGANGKIQTVSAKGSEILTHKEG